MISQSEQSKHPRSQDGVTRHDTTVASRCVVHFQKTPEFSQKLPNLLRNFSDTSLNNQSGRFPVFPEELERQENHKVNKNTLKLSTKIWFDVFNE